MATAFMLAIIHVHSACSEHCNQDNMRCFGHTPEECCNFYDPHDNDKCLDECPPERLITENFYCTGLHFTHQNVHCNINIGVLHIIAKSTFSGCSYYSGRTKYVV